jgi:hypothetical protein
MLTIRFVYLSHIKIWIHRNNCVFTTYRKTKQKQKRKRKKEKKGGGGRGKKKYEEYRTGSIWIAEFLLALAKLHLLLLSADLLLLPAWRNVFTSATSKVRRNWVLTVCRRNATANETLRETSLLSSAMIRRILLAMLVEWNAVRLF